MHKNLFGTLLKEALPPPSRAVRVYRESDGSRRALVKRLGEVLAEHYVGEATVVKAGGYENAADTIRNSLPTGKRTRSGDLAEVLATEYVNSETTFRVPISKLRWKDDREMPMRGNDVVGIDTSVKPTRVLKGECKSRQNFTDVTVRDAVLTLDKHDGRPNPSTLAFITKRLYEDDRDEEARVFQRLQCDGALLPRYITHSIFALTGNDPQKALMNAPSPQQAEIKREATAVMILDHAQFIDAIFASAHGSRS